MGKTFLHYSIHILMIVLFSCSVFTPANGLLKREVGKNNRNIKRQDKRKDNIKYEKIKPYVTGDRTGLSEISVILINPPDDKTAYHRISSNGSAGEIEVQPYRIYQATIKGLYEGNPFCYYQEYEGRELDDMRVKIGEMRSRVVRFHQNTPDYQDLAVRVLSSNYLDSETLKKHDTFRFYTNHRYVHLRYEFGLSPNHKMRSGWRDFDMYNSRPIVLGGPLKGHLWEQNLSISAKDKTTEKMKLYFLTDGNSTVMNYAAGHSGIKRVSEFIVKIKEGEFYSDGFYAPIKASLLSLSYRKSDLAKVKTEHFLIRVPKEMTYIAKWYLWQFEEAYAVAEKLNLKHPPKYIELGLHLHDEDIAIKAKGGNKIAGISMPLTRFLSCSGYNGYVNGSAMALLHVFDGYNTSHPPGDINCPCIRNKAKRKRDVTYIPEPLK